MVTVARTLVGLAAAAFVLAVFTNFSGINLTTAEGYSRACTNLALLAIALRLIFPQKPAE